MKRDHIVFPKMKGKDQLKENMDIFNFKLEDSDYKKIDELNRDARFFERIQDDNYGFIPYW
jgi:diketogulonate reductase-like aldo/keto reductase